MRARIVNRNTIHGISRLTKNYILRALSANNSDLTGQTTRCSCMFAYLSNSAGGKRWSRSPFDRAWNKPREQCVKHIKLHIMT